MLFICVFVCLFMCSFVRSFVCLFVCIGLTLSFIEGAEEGGLKYWGICAGPDGMLYCAATAASSVLVIDPRKRVPLRISSIAMALTPPT